MSAVVIQQHNPGCCGPVKDAYKSTSSLALGIVQLVGAVLLIVFNIVGLLNLDGLIVGCFYLGYGFWCAIFYIVAGGLAVGAARTKSSGVIITNMIFSIIAALVGIGGLYIGCTCLSAVVILTRSPANIAIVALMVVILLILFVSSIWSSALCCAVACCGARNTTTQTMVAVPMTQSGYPHQQGVVNPVAGQYPA